MLHLNLIDSYTVQVWINFLNYVFKYFVQQYIKTIHNKSVYDFVTSKLKEIGKVNKL